MTQAVWVAKVRGSSKSTGYKSSVGIVGTVNTMGATGTTGTVSTIGTAGTIGSVGTLGDVGDVGDIGATGNLGIIGTTFCGRIVVVVWVAPVVTIVKVVCLRNYSTLCHYFL